jgi:hypothetical protein
MIQNILPFMLTILLAGTFTQCKTEPVFPKLKNVSGLTKTDFTPTLESTFDTEKNAIYGATISFAWHEIRNAIGGTLHDFTSKQLEVINQGDSYANVLLEDEYETSVRIDGDEISATAYFRKSLPFEEPLTKFETPLFFMESPVESFGFWGSSSNAGINYYTDENNFSISLFPENDAHEIILIMHQGKTVSMKEYFDLYAANKNNETSLNTDDKVEIPYIAFNLQKNYTEIIDSKFHSDKNIFTMKEVNQTNAFVLNEKGAEVESFAEMATEASEEINAPAPKMMIFNQPFVVLLKRKEASHPYFGVYIANPELLHTVK